MTIKNGSQDHSSPVVTATAVHDYVLPSAPPAEAEIDIAGSSVPIAIATATPIFASDGVATTTSSGGPAYRISTTTTATTYIPPPAGVPVTTTAPPLMNVGVDPMKMRCPHCHQDMLTKTKHQTDAHTVLAVVLLIIFFWPLFWLPFICPACKKNEHYCGLCGMKVGENSCQCCS